MQNLKVGVLSFPPWQSQYSITKVKNGGRTYE